MSGKRVLAVYAALLLGFAVVLCRLYLLALHPAYAARAAAQSTVTLQLPARRGNFYDAQGRLLTGLEERWQVVCFPGQGNYDRLYACTDAAGQALLYRSRSRAAPFLLEVSCDPARLGLTGYPTARRYAAVPLCQHLLGYLDSTGHGAAGLEKALPAALAKQGTALVLSVVVMLAAFLGFGSAKLRGKYNTARQWFTAGVAADNGYNLSEELTTRENTAANILTTASNTLGADSAEVLAAQTALNDFSACLQAVQNGGKSQSLTSLPYYQGSAMHALYQADQALGAAIDQLYAKLQEQAADPMKMGAVQGQYGQFNSAATIIGTLQYNTAVYEYQKEVGGFPASVLGALSGVKEVEPFA